MVGRSVEKLKKSKKLQESERAKSSKQGDIESQGNGGVEPHGAKPDMVKLILRARLRGC